MHDLNVVHFLANILVILFSAKVCGELAERWRQPAVLGELLGGVILGFGFFTFFSPSDPALVLMAEFGVILLLFETGLESDLAKLLRVGPVALAVAAAGVILPFALGYVVMTSMGHGGMKAVFVGAALTATSVGITARVLSDLGKLSTKEAQIVLGAAVIDDVLGVIILSAVEGMAATEKFSWFATIRSTILALGFLGVSLWLGPYASTYLLKAVETMRVRGVLIASAICFAFALALIAHSLGTALIVGAFTAGILLARTDHRARIDEAIKPVSDIFVPVFFVMVGAKVKLTDYNPFVADNWSMLSLAALLIVVAIAGKFASGWAAWSAPVNRARIGIGMIPRGEVGLIFAQIGLASQVIDQSFYAAVVLMVVVTTFLAPPLLERSYRSSP